MKHTALAHRISIAALCVPIMACSTSALLTSQDTAITTAQQAVTAQTNRLQNAVMTANAQRESLQDVDRPYLAGRAQPLSKELTLPLALRNGVKTTALFPNGQLNLQGIAEAITMATGIVVKIRPDALLPLASFTQRSAGTTATQTAGTNNPEVRFQLAEVPLNEALDVLKSRLGVDWRYTEKNEIEIYRLDTRVFTLRALNQKVSSTSGLGRNSGSNAMFENSSSTKLSSDNQDVLLGIKKTVEALMTKAGTSELSSETKTLVVTDTTDSLERIARFIDQENRKATRRIKLVFESIDVTSKDGSEAGINWNLLYSNLTASGIARNLLTTSPASLTSSQAGSVGIGVTGGPFDGSGVVVKALAEVGKVHNHTVIPMAVLNGRPVSHAVRSTFDYVNQIQTTTNNGVSSASSTQKEETVGMFITLVPEAYEDGQILMSISYDNTSLDGGLKPFTVGSAGSGMTVQQKTISGAGIVQQAVLRSGVPTIIGGIERSSTATNIARLDKDAPMLLGGSDKVSQSKNTTVLMVTAVVEEGI